MTMMNDATRATVDLVQAAVRAQGYMATVREYRDGATVFVDEDRSHFSGFASKANIGHVTVHESGRWSEVKVHAVSMMKLSPELDALRQRRMA
jgi:hypothetical protein